MHYRIGAIRSITGSRKIRPQLSTKLRVVYDTISDHPLAPNLRSLSEIHLENYAIVEFHAATCAVRENMGSFYVNIWRHGNLVPEFKIR